MTNILPILHILPLYTWIWILMYFLRYKYLTSHSNGTFILQYQHKILRIITSLLQPFHSIKNYADSICSCVPCDLSVLFTSSVWKISVLRKDPVRHAGEVLPAWSQGQAVWELDEGPRLRHRYSFYIIPTYKSNSHKMSCSLDWFTWPKWFNPGEPEDYFIITIDEANTEMKELKNLPSFE